MEDKPARQLFSRLFFFPYQFIIVYMCAACLVFPSDTRVLEKRTFFLFFTLTLTILPLASFSVAIPRVSGDAPGFYKQTINQMIRSYTTISPLIKLTPEAKIADTASLLEVPDPPESEAAIQLLAQNLGARYFIRSILKENNPNVHTITLVTYEKVNGETSYAASPAVSITFANYDVLAIFLKNFFITLAEKSQKTSNLSKTKASG